MSGLQVDWNGDIHGDWTLDSLTTDTGVALYGHVTTATLTVGNLGSVIVTGGSLTITGDATVGRNYSGSGGFGVYSATLTELGTLTLSYDDNITVAFGSKVTIGSLVSDPNSVGALTVDATSSLEFGLAGVATAGQIVIDAGQTVSRDGNHAMQAVTVINNGLLDSGFIAVQNFVNNGTLNDRATLYFAQSASIVNAGVINDTGFTRLDAPIITNTGEINVGGYLDLVGAVSGTGHINLGANAKLNLEGDLGAGQAVAFTGENATLELQQQPLSSNLPGSIEGTITGFDGSDTLLLDNQYGTSVTWTGGVLTVFNGSDIIETFNLQGSFASSDFVVTTGNNQTMLTLAKNAADTVVAPAGTTTGDTFVFQGPPNGSWDAVGNWYDTATGVSPNVIAPGAGDSVVFNAQSSIQRITGTGKATNVEIDNGAVNFSGQFTFGTLTNNAGLTVASGTMTTGAVTGGGAISVASGARFVDTGDFGVNIGLSGGSMVVGGTLNVTSFAQDADVSNGGSLQVGALVLGSYFVMVRVDSTSSMEVGVGGHVVAGELLVDAGATIDSTAYATIQANQFENDGAITSNSQLTFFITTFTNKGTITGTGNLDADVLVTNSGQIFATSFGISTATLQNTGLIASTGNLSVNGAITGTGEIDIDSTSGGAASAAFNDDVAAGQTIKMIGAASNLQQNTGSTIEATITGFGIGDTLQVSTALTSATYTGGTLSLFNGSTLVETLNIGAGYSAAHFTVAFDGSNSTITTDSNAALGQTYTLTKKTDSFTGPASDDVFIAAVGTLNAKDVIDGGGGGNTLELTGSGQFDLATPKTLTNIQVLDVFENMKGSLQNVHLRDGLNLTVNVADATFVPALTAANRISRAHDLVQAGGGDETTGARLFGANDSSVFNLGGGLDIVTLGSATEVINGKGDALIKTAAAFAGAKITGGGGVTVLDLKSGGTAVMNAADTGITLVSLDNTNSAYNFTANAEVGLVIEDDNNHGGDVITAGGAGQTLTGGGAGVTLIASASGGDVFRNTSANFNGEMIGGFATAGNVIDVTNLASTKIKTATFVENAAGTSGTLTLAGSGQSTAITLFGQFMAAGFHGTAAQAGFTLGSDGSGGTNVTYHPVLAPGH